MTIQSPRSTQKRSLSITAGRRFPRLAAAAIGVLFLTPAAQSQIQIDSAVNSVLGTNPSTFWFNLDRLRPPAVAPDFKKYVINTLPEKGEIKKLKEPAQRKLASLQEILRVHQRESVYEIKVIGVAHAFVGLHARCVLLISEAALNLLSTEELQASAAHEIGHEYVWAQYEEARQRKDYRHLQELEMFCDAVSIVTLRRAGMDPSHVVRAFEKLVRFEHGYNGPGEKDDLHPPLAERKQFSEAVMHWADSHGGSRVTAK